ncbi:hypothetical protein IQ63_37300 [Streptomyces acidiscabies]|uniref:Uncharacterized protein n=1 Tax=Streptomyces acidiscabies TaxID=42234 RepID=A0A0L0JKX1_9ACTN|nr:hypothetical protein IQ63_37300 [Streptomyces acidiscabies]
MPRTQELFRRPGSTASVGRVTDGQRWGRTVNTIHWTSAVAPNAVPSAGSVRPVSSAASTPTASAHSAYAVAAGPLATNAPASDQPLL